MIQFLIEKEFKQLFRNSFLPKMIIIYPFVMMIILPWATNMEIKDLTLTVVDNDRSTLSTRFTDKLQASDYFNLYDISTSYKSAMSKVEKGEIDVILEIPPRLENDLINGNDAHILVAVNAVNGTKGGLSSNYLSTIIHDYSNEIRSSYPASGSLQLIPTVEVSSLYLFNPYLDYKLFIVPGIMLMLLTLLCGFLPALNIVGEKEAGTIEQINVSPVSKFTFILAKLLPYWIIGLLVLTICFVLAWLSYDIVATGSYLTIYLFSAIYVFAMSGLGLLISNHSATMQQAMFVMFFFLIIFMLMSGLFTPTASMPGWAQVVTQFNPLKHIIQAVRSIYLKGSGVGELLPQLFALLGFAVVFNGWAVLSYRKKS